MGPCFFLAVLLPLLGPAGVHPWKVDYLPRSVSRDFSLKILIPPPLAAAPFDVSLGPGGVAVVEVREGRVLGFTPAGEPVEAGRGVEGPLFAHDGKGNFYSYSFPSGRIQRIDIVSGKVRVVGKVGESHTGGSIAVTSSGKRVWVLRGKDEGGDLFFLRAGADGFRIMETGGVHFKALASLGERVFGLADDGVYELKEDPPARVVRFRRPMWMEGGFTVAGENGFFLVFRESGRSVFAHADWKGRFRVIYRAPAGFNVGGIDLDRVRGKLWFVCKEKGAVGYLGLGKVPRKGRGKKAREVWVCRAEGVVTPIAVGVAPDGKVYVNGDEVGVYGFDKKFKPFVLYRGICCYQPPPADFVAERGCRLVYSAAAPGFPGTVLSLRKGKPPKVLYREKGLFLPGGIARLGGGRYLVADYGSGRFLAVSSRGAARILDKGYRFPLGVAVGKDGSWYITCSKPGRKGDPRSVLPLYPEVLVRRWTGGRREVLFDVHEVKGGGHLFFLDVCPDGGVAFAAGGTVRRYDPVSGKVTVLAEGLRRAAGVAADRSGNIYITDYDAHALLLLRKKSK